VAELQAASEDDDLAAAVPVAPRLAAAAAAAAASSGSSLNSSLRSSGAKLLAGTSSNGHFVRLVVEVCVHRVGAFRLKGVDSTVNVVQVLPAGLEERLPHLLASSSSSKASLTRQPPAVFPVNTDIT
jgi:hypothetical protein